MEFRGGDALKPALAEENVFHALYGCLHLMMHACKRSLLLQWAVHASCKVQCNQGFNKSSSSEETTWLKKTVLSPTKKQSFGVSAHDTGALFTLQVHVFLNDVVSLPDELSLNVQ